MAKELAFVLIGDHLGQVKKLLQPSNEISILLGSAPASKSNPVVSIEPIDKQNKQLIANQNGQLYVYDCVRDTTELGQKFEESLNKALPISDGNNAVLLYDRQIILNDGSVFFKHSKKASLFKNAKITPNRDILATVGTNIPLRLFDLETKARVYDAEPPEKDWLGISPEVYVGGLDFLSQTRIATCSRSDSTIRVYDTLSKRQKPVILANVDQTASNEHADSARFHSIAATSLGGNSVVVGSNVGQIMAIDFRFQNVKPDKIAKKRSKLQPKAYKMLGNFKGSRGGSMKDIKVIPSFDDGDSDNTITENYKVLSCCLDRYFRIHNFNKKFRDLDKHAFITTKPVCCSPVFYDSPL